MVELCVVGLGYVGLPLASAFAEEGYRVTGFDVDNEKISRLNRGNDDTGEPSDYDLSRDNLKFTSDSSCIEEADFVFVCVPTPLDDSKRPDLSYLRAASRTVGEHLRADTTVVYESTVYPGTTEEVCLPILEEYSGMELGDFHIAYSPERISPGDDAHTLGTTTKILAASNLSKEDELVALYESILTEGTHTTPTIRVAEAAKVIENTQRDLNIALMNELSQLFNTMEIDTSAVIEAAATKWNFHEYHPGLVGGHCIGVDPYYLTYKAQQEGHDPQVILAGRSINDRMYEQAVEMLLRGLNEFEKVPKRSTVVILGLTYKENVGDARNSQVKPLINELEEYGVDVRVLDPVLGESRIEELGYTPITGLEDVSAIDGVVNAVPHDSLSHISLDTLEAAMEGPILVDVRGTYEKDVAENRGFYYRSF